jgi:protein-disulfide isomerase
MEKVVAANSDVKFIFKPLSFVAPVSGYQAKAGMAANKQGKFYEFYKAVLGSEERMNEAAVDAVAAGLGLNMEQFKADIASDETSKNLNAIRELSQNIQVNGVPTVMINGKHISTMSADDLQNAINAAK